MSQLPPRRSLRTLFAAVTTSALVVAGLVFSATPALADDGTMQEPVAMIDTAAPVADEQTAPDEAAVVAPAAETAASRAPQAEEPPAPSAPEQAPAAPEAAPAPVAAAVPLAELQVSKTTGLNPDGETLTITGTGYMIDPAGIYAQLGWIIDGAWTPISTSETRATNRAAAQSAWIGSGYPGQPSFTVAADGSGSFSWMTTITQAEADAKKLDGGVLAVFTLGAHGNFVQPKNERFVPIAFGGEQLGTTTTTALTPSAQTITAGQSVTLAATVTPAAAAGTVSFYEGITLVGGPVSAAGGLAGVALAGFAAGVHSITARFAPSDIESYTGSLSNPVSITVNAPSTPAGPTATVATGSLIWAISSSFAAYIRGPIASGRITVGGGATAAGGAYQFGQAPGGSYSAATGTGTVNYTGSVNFFGHGGLLDMTFANPVVDVRSASEAELYVTVNGRQVAFATVALDGAAKSEANGAVTFSGARLTLTSAAAGLFQGFGFSPDPLTFTVGAAGSAPVGVAGVTAFATSAKAGPLTVTERTITAPAKSCTVASSTLAWGFKESFRSYIEGIANGGWELGGGAEYAYSNYSFTGNSGGFDAETAAGIAPLAGSVRFTGHDGALDTTISNPQIEFVDAETAFLLVDVTGETQSGDAVSVSGIRFAELDLTAGTLTASETGIDATGIPAVMVADGASAFGTYGVGEELDPVSFSIAFADACGTQAAAEEVAALSSGSDDENDTAAAETEESAADFGWIPWTLGIMVLIGAAITATVVILRRRGTPTT